jgi:hypothetical protein
MGYTKSSTYESSGVVDAFAKTENYSVDITNDYSGETETVTEFSRESAEKAADQRISELEQAVKD